MIKNDDIKKLFTEGYADEVLCNACQLLDGWRCKEAWTEWDESVRKSLSDLKRRLANFALALEWEDENQVKPSSVK